MIHTNYYSEKPHQIKTIYKDRSKGLSLSAYIRDDKKHPLIIKVENVKTHESYMLLLSKAQTQRLWRRIMLNVY